MKKKGQIQLGETIFIVIFIILIIVFGLVFFSQAEGEGIKERQAQFQELDIITLSQYVSSLNEIKCSTLEVEELSCFDKTKLDAFVNLTKNDWSLVGEYYVSKLGTSKIELREIYPTKKNWTIYEYTGSLEREGVFYAGRQIQIPVALENPVSQTKSFGVLYLTVYDKVIR